jgi:hypothetical protein
MKYGFSWDQLFSGIFHTAGILLNYFVQGKAIPVTGREGP